LLLDPNIVARPRFVRIGQPGAPERRSWPKTVQHSRVTPTINALREVDRHVVDLVLCDSRYELDWAWARTEDRVAELHRWRNMARSEGLSMRDSTRIGRALWDNSLRVQLAALDLVESLGRDAAMFVPGLAAQRHGRARWRARVVEVLDTLSRDRELVGALIDDFSLDDYGMLEWFERAGLIDDALLDRLERVVESNTMPSAWWVKGVVRSFVRKHRPS
jgi:hypothetical protein